MSKGAKRGRAAGDAAVPRPVDFQELDAAGWIVIPDVLPSHEAARLAQRCDELVEHVAAEPRVGDKKTGMHRLVDVLERVPEVSSIFGHPALTAAVGWFLGDQARLTEVIFRAPGPGAGEQRLHTDDVPLEAGDPWRVVTAIIALCDFTEDNGATGLVPGSHRRPDLQRQAGKLDSHRDEVVAIGRAGTAFVFCGHLLHRGRRNRSDRPRPALQASWRLAGASSM